MPNITLNNLSGGDVRNISLEIRDREFVVLTGLPRCGNAAIIRMLAGLSKISAGDIFMGERRVNDLPPNERDVAMVFPDDALYPQMSVRQNITFGLKKRKFSKTEIAKRVADAASILKVEDLLEEMPSALSREERQRVAIARAVARKPKVFLLDRPLENLDAVIGAQLLAELKKLQQRLQVTIIYATHDPIEAMILADRIVLLRDGVVAQDGAPLALYDEPLNLFVAGFLGRPPMNFLHGTLKESRELLVFSETEGGTIEVRFSKTESTTAADFVGKPIVLGVRPEDILTGPSQRPAENLSASFSSIVDHVELRGAETNLHLLTGAHTIICRSPRLLDIPGAGRRLPFQVDLSKSHFFDPVTTRRIS
ncbi:MAG: ATP-binding cassette domain-containing protein [Verrucomicrobiota bacterium]